MYFYAIWLVCLLDALHKFVPSVVVEFCVVTLRSFWCWRMQNIQTVPRWAIRGNRLQLVPITWTDSDFSKLMVACFCTFNLHFSFAKRLKNNSILLLSIYFVLHPHLFLRWSLFLPELAIHFLSWTLQFSYIIRYNLFTFSSVRFYLSHNWWLNCFFSF